MSKVIHVNIGDKSSIRSAIRKVRYYRDVTLPRRIENLVQKLVDTGVDVAKVKVVEMGAYYTGQLESSIMGYYSPSTQTGFVVADAPYAFFVEYGTGVVGAANPHPMPIAYDVNGHGEQGWVYLNDRDGKWHRTSGYRSRPFFYETARHLEQECERIAKGVFRK